MPREYKYRGFTLEQLQNMRIVPDFVDLLPSRQRRSLTRGNLATQNKNLYDQIILAKQGKLKGQIRTQSRDMVILPIMAGLTLMVHSGKEYVQLEIKPEMIGHYLGEFVITNKKVQHGTPGIGASRSSLYVPLK